MTLKPLLRLLHFEPERSIEEEVSCAQAAVMLAALEEEIDWAEPDVAPAGRFPPLTT